jgi:hypothetical protein
MQKTKNPIFCFLLCAVSIFAISFQTAHSAAGKGDGQGGDGRKSYRNADSIGEDDTDAMLDAAGGADTPAGGVKRRKLAQRAKDLADAALKTGLKYDEFFGLAGGDLKRLVGIQQADAIKHGLSTFGKVRDLLGKDAVPEDFEVFASQEAIAVFHKKAKKVSRPVAIALLNIAGALGGAGDDVVRLVELPAADIIDFERFVSMQPREGEYGSLCPVIAEVLYQNIGELSTYYAQNKDFGDPQEIIKAAFTDLEKLGISKGINIEVMLKIARNLFGSITGFDCEEDASGDSIIHFRKDNGCFCERFLPANEYTTLLTALYHARGSFIPAAAQAVHKMSAKKRDPKVDDFYFAKASSWLSWMPLADATVNLFLGYIPDTVKGVLTSVVEENEPVLCHNCLRIIKKTAADETLRVCGRVNRKPIFLERKFLIDSPEHSSCVGEKVSVQTMLERILGDLLG